MPDHRALRDDAWWQPRITRWRDVPSETFHDHKWQLRHSVTRRKDLLALVEECGGEPLARDVAAGLDAAPMAVRISPYLLSLIDWKRPHEDPIRRQFLPLGRSVCPSTR